MEFFSNIGKIQYKGKDSTDPLSFKYYNPDEVINGKTVSVYDTAVTSDMVWKTICYSVVFTAVYLTIAYVNFKKKDRD